MVIGTVNIFFIFLSLFAIRNFRGVCSYKESWRGTWP